MTDFVWRDGSRLTPWMDYQIGRLSADMKRLFRVEVKVSSGIRLNVEQRDIFFRRYVSAGNINGRRVYDTRWFEGRLWYRISDAGTVAQPGSSNHEMQGNTAAADLRDTGSDAGITSKNSKRGRWFRQNAWRYDMEAEGDNFGEGWHMKMKNIFNKVPGGSGTKPKPAPKKEDKVQRYFRDDAKALRTKRVNNKVVPVGVDLQPAASYWLNTDVKSPTSHATNIVGGIGEYSFAVHLYAEGTPGDIAIVKLFWDDTKTAKPHSGHFEHHAQVLASGLIRINVPFWRGVAKGDAVYAHVQAAPTNKAPLKVTRFATDASLFLLA